MEQVQDIKSKEKCAEVREDKDDTIMQEALKLAYHQDNILIHDIKNC